MEPEITSKTFDVRFSDCDHNSRLKLSNLFLFMEETAIADAEINGFGLWKLLKLGYTYVITRLKIRINHTPVWGEKLTISTWAKEFYNDKVCLKDYSILDSQGNAIAQATSSWLLVNLKTGKSENPANSPCPPPLYPDRNALPDMLDILDPGQNPVLAFRKIARYSDLDMNRHVNHCRYVDWVMDALSLDEIKNRQVRSIQMNYINQIPLGETVRIIRFENSNHHAKVFGVNEFDANKCHFQARIGFGD
ncbi:MAG: acyl-ACP thioesterase [Fibrobacteraceae bacterium]|nr:acyl-ACP thioesterase [Fibrobacteraceae bacterium]